jgi:hypothetical protein
MSPFAFTAQENHPVRRNQAIEFYMLVRFMQLNRHSEIAVFVMSAIYMASSGYSPDVNFLGGIGSRKDTGKMEHNRTSP